MAKLIKTDGVTDIINVSSNMGDQLNNMFQKNKDLKTANLALTGYRTAVAAAKAQIMYKRLTGSPEVIEFFEK